MSEKLTRHNVLLFEGDFEELRSYYSTLSPTHVIRSLLRKHLNEIKAKIREKGDSDGRPEHLSGTIQP